MPTSFPMANPWVDLEGLNASKMTARVTTPINDLYALLAPLLPVVRADVTNVTGQSVTTSTDTTVTGWAGTTGSGITYSAGVWTVVTAGYYVMSGQIAYPNIASPAGQRVGRIKVNGTIVHELTNVPSASFNCPCTLVYAGQFAVGDTITVSTFQSQGANAAMATTAGLNHFHIRLVGP